MDMYGRGCQHNCAYCFARGLLDFRGLWDPVRPAIADRAKVAKQLDKIPAGTTLRLGGMTDPFAPIESVCGHTRWLIGELNHRRIGYLIVTKSGSVSDCLDILDGELAHVQISYTYTEGLEPPGYETADSPENRLSSAAELFAHGIDTQLRLSPFVPQFVDLNRVIRSPVEKVLVEFMRVNNRIKAKLPDVDFAAWSEKSGGYLHLPLETKLEHLQPILGKKRVSVCEDHPAHYEYFRENINPNKSDCCDLRR